MSSRDKAICIIIAAFSLICAMLGVWATRQEGGTGVALVMMFLSGLFMGIFMMVFGREAVQP